MAQSISARKGPKLPATDDQLGQLFQHNPLPMWVYDLETLAFLAVNDAAVKNYGFSEEEFLRMTIKDIRPEDQIPALLEYLKANGPALKYTGEWKHRAKDGRVFIVKITTSELIDYKNKKAILVVAQDITAQKIAEQALRESDEKLRYHAELVENVTDAIISCDLNFHIISWNKAAETIYGWRAEEVVGKDWDSLCQTKYVETTREKLIAELLGTGKWGGEFEHTRKDGEPVHVQCLLSTVENQSGAPVRIVMLNRDISQRRMTEVALRESQRQLATLMSNLPGMAYRGKNDADWTMEFVSDGCEALTGYKPTDLINSAKIPYEKVTHPDDAGRVRKIIENGIEKHQPYELTYRIITASGKEKWVWEQGRAIYDDAGNLLALEGFITDITQRIDAENALRDSEQRFRVLAETAPDLIFLYRLAPTPGFVFVSSSATTITGYTPEEYYADPDLGTKLIHPEDLPLLDGIKRRAQGYIVTLRWVRKDGQVIWMEQRTVPVFDEQGTPIALQAIARDISESKNRERDLEALYQSGMSLQQVSNPKAIARNVIELLEQFMEWHHAAVWIRLGRSENIEQLAYSQAHPYLETIRQEQARSQTLVRNIHTGLAGWVIGHGETVRNGDVRNDPHYMQVNESILSGLYVPLKVGNETIGCISAESTLPDAFSAYDERLLTTVAAQAAIALDNARLYDETRKNAEQLSKLNALSRELAATLALPSIYHTAYTYVRQFLDCPNFGIFLFDGMQQTISAVFLIVNEREIDASGISSLHYDNNRRETGQAKAIAGATPIVVGDLAQEGENADLGLTDELSDHEEKSAIYTPMVVDGLVIGLLEIHSYQKNAYSSDDAQLLSTIANQIGLSIQNARLFTQIEHQLRQLSALRSIDNAISSNTDLNTTLSIILDHVKSELGVDAADILLLKSETMTLEHAANRGFRSDVIQRLSLRLGEGIAGKTALERKPALIKNLMDGQFRYKGVLSAEQFITYANAPLLSKGQLKGVLEVFHRSQLKTDREWLTFLEMMGNEAAIAIDSADLFYELQRSNLDLTIAYDATIEGWAQALELRDAETEGHSRRVAELTLRLARAMNIHGPELVHIRRGSLLHDIGKMGVPDYILRKAGLLTDEEMDIMRQHPLLAQNLLARIPYLRPALDIPYSHHEYWDGSGYPRKLRGEQIPLAARIFAVVDVYDALTNERSYHKARSHQEALDFIRRESGIHFDPNVVETFLKMMDAG